MSNTLFYNSKLSPGEYLQARLEDDKWIDENSNISLNKEIEIMEISKKINNLKKQNLLRDDLLRNQRENKRKSNAQRKNIEYDL